MVRIEMQLTEEEVAIIEQIAKEESRSRKKQCEVYIRKMISDYKRKRSLATNIPQLHVCCVKVQNNLSV